MSTRSATIIKQTTYWGDEPETAELMRFYRHCDGYPEGHGLEMAHAIKNLSREGGRRDHWVAGFLKWFLNSNPYAQHIEFEDNNCQHGDLEYLYLIEGTVDNRWGISGEDAEPPITIGVYEIGFDESYSDALGREPLFKGTAYDYIKRFE